jgi:hypothetical protein
VKNILTALLISTIFVGCAAKTGSGEGETAGCIKPSKKYGNADVDDFLQTSFDICEKLQKAKELLSDANEFAANPSAYIAKRGAQAKAQLLSKVTKMIPDLTKIAKNAVNTAAGSGNATSATANLPGMDKIKAAKDIANAVKNLKSIGETAPKVADELNSLLSKLK